MAKGEIRLRPTPSRRFCRRTVAWFGTQDERRSTGTPAFGPGVDLYGTV